MDEQYVRESTQIKINGIYSDYSIHINFLESFEAQFYLWDHQQHLRLVNGLEARSDLAERGLKRRSGRWAPGFRPIAGASYSTDTCEMAGLEVNWFKNVIRI